MRSNITSAIDHHRLAVHIGVVFIVLVAPHTLDSAADRVQLTSPGRITFIYYFIWNSYRILDNQPVRGGHLPDLVSFAGPILRHRNSGS